MIASMNNDKSYALIEQFVSHYPDHNIVYVACAPADLIYASRLQGVYPDMMIYDRCEYTMVQTLSLFDRAEAGIGCRLHFLLLLQ
jgi:hypothetical protein